MIWLASFPRSGNTFFRNVLYEVYGIESSTFHKETSYPVDENYEQYEVVKTHLLPGQVKPNDPSIKSVYLVRDGRDALVSIAHHRKDFVAPHSDYYINLLEAIIAAKGSFFGGWSRNVEQWTEKADIIIRFEDLIRDPVKEVEKLRSIFDLPPARYDKLPTFKDLKFGTPQYGSTKKFVDNEKAQKEAAAKSFRKGKSGGWKDEMPPELEQLFWDLHGETMENMGYRRETTIKNDSLILPSRNLKNNLTSPFKVLIEANKIFTDGNDGIKRYVLELVEGLSVFQDKFYPKWEIDLYLEGGFFLELRARGENAKSFAELVEEETERRAKVIEDENVRIHTPKPYERNLLQIKDTIKKALPPPVYNGLSSVYRNLPFRLLLRHYRNFLTKPKIEELNTVFDQYDLIHIPLPQHFSFLKYVKGNFLVTVHDLTHKYFPEYHTEDNVTLSEKGMQEAIKKEAHILAISHSSKKDILESYPEIKAKDVSVIYEACNRNYFQPQSDKTQLKKVLNKYQLPDVPYFLTLSTVEPRKNLLNTIKAFEELLTEQEDSQLALFICGKKGWKTDELFELENLSDKNIFFTGFVEEEDLPVFYSHALALCYVSFYEGFGLPPLEAMSCDTTVIYGDNSSMPEVIKDGGLAANPNDIEDIKQKMKVLLLDKEKRLMLNEKAQVRANQFSWTKTAWETLQLYEKIIKEKT